VVAPPLVALIRASTEVVMGEELPELPDCGVIQSPTFTVQLLQPLVIVDES